MSDDQWKIFLDVPDDIDETWTHVALFGGMSNRALPEDFCSFATHFKKAGDALVQKLEKVDSEAYEILNPVLYLYRHSIELYLKSFLGEIKTHNLQKLLHAFKDLMKSKYNWDIPVALEIFINEFDVYDRSSTVFRYPSLERPGTELMVNLYSLRNNMDSVSDFFQRLSWKVRHP